ncbi:MAG: hypothetical protein Q9164_000492 [Protoblastenia rupestris]
MSLRRSTRAPTAQPAAVTQQHPHSSTSYVLSGRLDRNVRSHQKTPSPQSSVAANSRSSEDQDDSTKAPPRRTRSKNDEAKTEPLANFENDNDDNDDNDEETRCICGQQEYPGLPVTSSDVDKDKSQVNSDPISVEDNTGWFIQCDNCQVWQHGGCVGILDESQSPEKYFCEECHKDLHVILIDVNGRKHSRYLPIQNAISLTSSPGPKVEEISTRTVDSRVSRSELESLSKGRRATMNSRESAYHEAEELRRAIEASKKDSMAKGADGTRKGKRSRGESQDRDEDAKRRQTTSGSSSSHSKSRRQDVESDEEKKQDKFMHIRGAAARNHRNKEVREREAVKDRGPTDGSRKRGQNHQRKSDDSEPSPEPLSRTVSSRGAPPTSKTTQAPVPKSHKKGGRPPARRGRLGRNQYSKDREPPSENPKLSSPTNNSKDGENAVAYTNGNANGFAESNGVGKPSRPRHMNPNRTTMNDMKRRVAGILEFISHIQVELAGLDASRSRSNTQNSTKASSSSTTTPPDINGNGITITTVKDVRTALNALGGMEEVDEEAYGKLSAVEMMEVLTRRLMGWQGEYGKYGER